MKRLTLILALALCGCATPPAGTSPGQALVNQTATTCAGIVSAMKAADAAVVQGLLKGEAARNALKGFTAAQAGCESALASIQSANPASGASK